MTRKRKKRFTMSEAIYFLAKVKPHEQLREKQFLIKSILINTMKTETRNFVPIDTLGLPALLIIPSSIQNPNSKEQNSKNEDRTVVVGVSGVFSGFGCVENSQCVLLDRPSNAAARVFHRFRVLPVELLTKTIPKFKS